MPDTDSIKQLTALIEKNIALTEELEERVKKIHTYVKWQRVYFVIKIVLIVVPLTLGIIYLPPLLQDAAQPYQELLGSVQNLNSAAQGVQNVTGGLDINTLINEFAR